MTTRDLPVALRAVAWAVAAAAVIGLAACGKKEEAVKIGHAGPLTGSIAHLGKDNENGVRMALDEANAAGFEIAGKKVTFSLQSEDDEATPERAPPWARSWSSPRSSA